MNNKLFSLTIFAVALAVASMVTVPGVMAAVSDNYNAVFIGTPDLFGVDEATNTASDRDRDISPPALDFSTYGLQGNWEPGQQ